MHVVSGESADCEEVAAVALGRGKHRAEQRLVERLVERQGARSRLLQQQQQQQGQKGEQDRSSPPLLLLLPHGDKQIEEGLLDLDAVEGIALCADAAREGWRGEGKKAGEEDDDDPDLTATLADDEGNVVVLNHEEVSDILKGR